MKNCDNQASNQSYCFYQIPKFLIDEKEYDELPGLSKLAYGLLKDRATLSKSNGEKWIDADGNVFVYFTNKELAKNWDVQRIPRGR